MIASRPKISIICALSKNRGIGKNNQLLFRIPQDLKRFKEKTTGHAVIMGRLTFESIGRPLPNRLNIVVSRSLDLRAPGCIVSHSIDEAIKIAKSKEKSEIFVIGGGQIYESAINIADKLYLTIVDREYDADTYFPKYDQFKKEVYKKKGKSNGLNYLFLDLER